ncbi:MAG: DUF4432 family protein [Firmicutes bacterium]|nr:DUF4432 family protein [Bacillota bacterium]
MEKGWTLYRYSAIIMENAAIRVVMLPGKGMDIVECLYKPRDVDVTAATPWGFTEDEIGTFLDRYEGGFQIVFPNGGPPSDYRGAWLGQHDEVALGRWQWQDHEDEAGVSVTATTMLKKTPFRYQRKVQLNAQEAVLHLEDTVTNLSPFEQEVMWGQHLAFGPPFLSPSCRFASGAQEVLVVEESLTSRRFKPGRYAWPYVERAEGGLWDLRQVPAKDGRHDMAYLVNFLEGWYTLENPQLGVGIRVEWDTEAWPCCWVWQECGADGYPWYGRHYSLGLEPFHGYPTQGLSNAIRNGSTLKIKGGCAITGYMRLALYEVNDD